MYLTRCLKIPYKKSTKRSKRQKFIKNANNNQFEKYFWETEACACVQTVLPDSWWKIPILKDSTETFLLIFKQLCKDKTFNTRFTFGHPVKGSIVTRDLCDIAFQFKVPRALDTDVFAMHHRVAIASVVGDASHRNIGNDTRWQTFGQGMRPCAIILKESWSSLI